MKSSKGLDIKCERVDKNIVTHRQLIMLTSWFMLEVSPKMGDVDGKE